MALVKDSVKPAVTPVLADKVRGLDMSGAPDTVTFLLSAIQTLFDAAVSTLTNKTLTAPVIGDFTNAAHNHANAAGGGWVTEVWIKDTNTWTRTGNHTFTIAADVTAIYTKGTKIRYKDGGAYEYGVVASSSYGAPNTTITLITNSDYAMAAATITDTYYSYSTPPDFPTSFNWAPAIVGWTTPPTTVARWAAFGNIIYIAVRQAAAAVSDSTVTTFSLPVAAKTVTDMVWSNTCRIADNGVSASTPGLMQIVSAGTLLEFYKDMIATVWTASGNKRIFSGQISYEY